MLYDRFGLPTHSDRTSHEVSPKEKCNWRCCHNQYCPSRYVVIPLKDWSSFLIIRVTLVLPVFFPKDSPFESSFQVDWWALRNLYPRCLYLMIWSIIRMLFPPSIKCSQKNTMAFGKPWIINNILPNSRCERRFKKPWLQNPQLIG